jgi:peptidoglycan/LPS O-acetylase OafA/YrhL
MLKIENKDLQFSPQFSILLDLLRWLSAFFVVIGHLRSVIFCNYKEILHPNLFLNAFYFLTGFGHEAVIVFFILSGYLISGSLFKDLNNNLLNFKRYFINRFSRIYIVYVPAIFLTLILDQIGIYFFNQSGIYNHGVPISSIPFNILDRENIQDLLGNLFMLQISYYPTIGSNGPLWSLA